jgi:hypothetical protein
MRTVLAIDEMLAYEVEQRLPGEVARLGHMAMRDCRHVLVQMMRDFLTRYPSVLAIGGRRWDALPLLRELRPHPTTAPVVLVAPEASPACISQAAELGVFSIVPVEDGFTGAASAVAVECQLATAVRRGLLSRPLSPVVVSRDRRASSDDRQLAPVVRHPACVSRGARG